MEGWNRASLQEVLENRERRAAAQLQMLEAYSRPLISFTMNIPGPVKNGERIRGCFLEGVNVLEKELESAGMKIVCRKELCAVTGNELLCAVDTQDAARVKEICLNIEEHHPAGRLFDLDVIGTDGKKLERRVPRCCIVCGKPGKECASRRLHSLGELTAAAEKIMMRSAGDT